MKIISKDYYFLKIIQSKPNQQICDCLDLCHEFFANSKKVTCLMQLMTLRISKYIQY